MYSAVHGASTKLVSNPGLVGEQDPHHWTYISVPPEVTMKYLKFCLPPDKYFPSEFFLN